MHIRSYFVVALGLVLASCATTYQKSGITGGYSEKKISDSAYIVTFNGNGFASRDRVYYFWLYRCAELTLQQGYGLYVIQANRPQALNAQPEATSRPATYTEGNGGALLKTHGGGGGGVIVVPGAGSGAAKWTFSATVLMYKQPLPPEVLWGVDAAQTAALLKPYVTSNGSIAPPSREEVFRKAFVAHAQISIGDDATVAIDAAANADGNSPANLRARSVDSIADAVSASRLIAFHAMYRAYLAKLKPADSKGEVVLEFTISPNGQVKDCRVTASSMQDPGFTDAIATVVGQTVFSPLDVATTRVNHFRIAFAELPQGGA